MLNEDVFFVRDNKKVAVNKKKTRSSSGIVKTK